MCHVRAYHHSCKHTAYRFVSTCRGTYTTDNAPSTPLCLSSEAPSIVMFFRDPCVSCAFECFKMEWEDIIRKAEMKRDMIQNRLSGTDPSFCGWGTISTCEWNQDAFVGSLSSFDDEYDLTLNNDNNTDTSIALSAQEECQLKADLAEASAELETLRVQFGKATWEQWHTYYSNSQWEAEKKRPGQWKRRKSSPKIRCGSNLRQVVNATELANSEETILGNKKFSGRRQNSIESISSGASDSSESSTLSMCSIASPDASPRAWNEDSLTCTGELKDDLHPEENIGLLRILDVEKLNNAPNLFWRNAEIDEEEFEDEMLPNWL